MTDWPTRALVLLLFAIILWMVNSQIQETLSQSDPLLEHLRNVLEPLHPCVKNLKLYSDTKSYTINKDKIYLCLRDQNGDYYPMNQLVYVLIHEIAHRVNSVDVGHTDEFYRIFDELLQKATSMGIYSPKIPIIADYSE